MSLREAGRFVDHLEVGSCSLFEPMGFRPADVSAPEQLSAASSLFVAFIALSAIIVSSEMSTFTGQVGIGHIGVSLLWEADPCLPIYIYTISWPPSAATLVDQ